MDLEVNRVQRRAAWKLYVELVTRIAVQKLGDDEGLLREALNSLYKIFEITRQILAEAGPDVARGPDPVTGWFSGLGREFQYQVGLKSQPEDDLQPFAAVAIKVLNEGLRPFTAKWHPLLKAYEHHRPATVNERDYERAWVCFTEMRQDLRYVQKEMVEYVKILARIADIKHTVPTPLESPGEDKTLFRNQHLAVIDRDDYTFVHEVRAYGVIVSLLPFRRKTNGSLEYLARLEICPAHGPDPELCSITGGLEPNKSVEETACLELFEEAGYHTTVNELINLGQVRPSKSADTVVHLFAVDVTGKTPAPPPGDGSRFEANASVEWVDFQQGLEIADPLFVTAIARLRALTTDP
jgi:8-oxo-dGTP pyrophosphatase MutT (NUDIX family)